MNIVEYLIPNGDIFSLGPAIPYYPLGSPQSVISSVPYDIFSLRADWTPFIVLYAIRDKDNLAGITYFGGATFVAEANIVRTASDYYDQLN